MHLLFSFVIVITNLFRTGFFMPNLIGGIILGYIWQLILNGILANLERTLTYNSAYGFWGLVILMCWQQVGYMMIIYIVSSIATAKARILIINTDTMVNKAVYQREWVKVESPQILI